jgi:hypothetical protein
LTEISRRGLGLDIVRDFSKADGDPSGTEWDKRRGIFNILLEMKRALLQGGESDC